jgi:thioredoxin-related protein
MKHRLLILLLIIVFASCGNNSNSSSTDETINTTPPPPPPQNLKPERFDYLENIFQNENWLMVSGSDSSYFYCSRLGKSYFKIYRYRIYKGDSVNTKITEIKSAADTIVWQALRDSMAIYLSSATPKQAVWANKTNNQFYIFNKVDSNNIHVTYPDGSAENMVKMQTLSAFLVRSRYDYLHGTKLVFNPAK